jgi:hypothetical protein
MKFVERGRYADADLAARKLVEIANGVDAVQDGRISIERINSPFLVAGGSGDDFRAGIERTIVLGWLWLHESGTYVKFTDSRALRFCLTYIKARFRPCRMLSAGSAAHAVCACSTRSIRRIGDVACVFELSSRDLRWGFASRHFPLQLRRPASRRTPWRLG